MGDIPPLDTVVLAILLLAAVRGLWIGLIREGFSIAAIAGACIAVVYGAEPASAWLVQVTRGQVSETVGPWLCGAAIAIVTVGVLGMVGRWLRNGARAVGLGWADRVAGGALGAAEGALIAAVVVLGVSYLVGRDHPAVAQSRSRAAFDDIRRFVLDEPRGVPDVAAGG